MIDHRTGGTVLAGNPFRIQQRHRAGLGRNGHDGREKSGAARRSRRRIRMVESWSIVAAALSSIAIDVMHAKAVTSTNHILTITRGYSLLAIVEDQIRRAAAPRPIAVTSPSPARDAASHDSPRAVQSATAACDMDCPSRSLYAICARGPIGQRIRQSPIAANFGQYC